MDELSRAWYDIVFRYKYVTAEGDIFQELFVSVMERVHPGDFVRVQPWGNKGDLKCDGFLASERRIFGCYGPKEFHPMPRALKKVRGDHEGATQDWPKMAAWTFVHNDHRGLPAQLLQLLQELDRGPDGVRVTHWGEPELTNNVRSLAAADLVVLFGAVPTARDVISLRQEDLRRVIPALAGAIAVSGEPGDFRPVPPDKLEYNKLSDNSRLFLMHGMQVSDRVQTFFNRWEPGVGDKIAAGFKERYRTLREEGDRTPDEILWALYEFAGHNDVRSTAEQTAVLALLAYLFESCEIFDRPPTGSGT